MKIIKNKIVAIIILLAVSIACKKAGTGGNAEIAAFPKHHELPIKNGIVYIKYNAADLPGTSATDFDDSAPVAGDHAHFHDLKKGKYYLYHIGYDSTIMSVVTGGIAVEIKKEQEYNVIIPVVE